jgi:cathepsin L
MQTYGLHFADGSEFASRIQIFADKVDLIESHNADTTQTFQMGLNQFSHLTLDEFREATHAGATRPPYLRSTAEKIHEAPTDISSLPTSVDWVTAGAVTDVKNQGSCGSCWSFSTTGALEGAYKIKRGTLKSFSEQQLVSCDKTNYGCNGGWMDTAFTWVKKNGGLSTESAYPYVNGATSTVPACKTGIALDSGVVPQSFTDVTKSVSALQSAVAQQPVSIAIQADQASFQNYKSGVLTSGCGQNLDHGVLLVGYGTLNGVDYWKVKNSWGPTWGLNGYILIQRSSADLCGVLDAASYPNL